MALDESTLATELRKLTPTASEAEGIQRFADAFRVYFRGATVNGIAATNTALAPAHAALAAALVGISAGGAAAKIQAGVVAFWGVVSSSAAAIWPGNVPPVLSATPPAGLSGLAASLTTVFAANTIGKKTLAESADAIATAIHATQTGGTVAVGPPSASFPIL